MSPKISESPTKLAYNCSWYVKLKFVWEHLWFKCWQIPLQLEELKRYDENNWSKISPKAEAAGTAIVKENQRSSMTWKNVSDINDSAAY